MKTYYYVMNPMRSLPTVKHETFESAKAEAERIAGKHAGHKIEILKCVAISEVKAPATTEILEDGA